MAAQDIRASIHPLYAVPLLQSHLPDAGPVNAELARLFLALEAEGDRHRDPMARDTQSGLFESNFFLHARPEPAVRTLFGFINQALHSLIKGLNGYDDAQIIEIVQHVALNTWTNYINEVAKTDVDFPVVAPRERLKRA